MEVVVQSLILLPHNLLFFDIEVENAVHKCPDEIQNVWHDEVVEQRIIREEGLICWMLQKPLLVFRKVLLFFHGYLSNVPHANQRDWMGNQTD